MRQFRSDSGSVRSENFVREVFYPCKLFHGDAGCTFLFKRLKCMYVACLSVFVKAGFLLAHKHEGKQRVQM